MAGDRTPLLLLPGTLCDRRVFEPLLDLVAPHCNGTYVGGLTRSSTIGDMAADVLAAAPPRFSLAGLSMGGNVAVEICRQAPQRVLRLALLGTDAQADTAERQRTRETRMDRARRGELERIVRDDLVPRYFCAAGGRREELACVVLDMARDLGPDVYLRQLTAMRDRPDALASLAQVTCPTLVLCGDEDDLCPPGHRAVAASAVPHARTRIIAHCGHLSTLERPTEVAGALADWLSWSGNALHR